MNKHGLLLQLACNGYSQDTAWIHFSSVTDAAQSQDNCTKMTTSAALLIGTTYFSDQLCPCCRLVGTRQTHPLVQPLGMHASKCASKLEFIYPQLQILFLSRFQVWMSIGRTMILKLYIEIREKYWITRLNILFSPTLPAKTVLQYSVLLNILISKQC